VTLLFRETLVLNYSFRPELNPDLKSGFKPQLRVTSVLAKSFRLCLKLFSKTKVSDISLTTVGAQNRDLACLLLRQHNYQQRKYLPFCDDSLQLNIYIDF